MSDISKCSGEGCPLREACYRFTAPTSEYHQSWIAPPYKNGECEIEWRKELNVC